MRSKVIGLLVVGIALAFLGAARTSSRSQQNKLAELEASKDRGTMRWYAAVAKAKGQNRVVVPAPTTEYAGGDIDFGLDKALADYGVVRARPIGKITQLFSADEIVTWYKFKVVETIAEQPKSPGYPADSIAAPPTELLPLAEDEFVTARDGGKIRIDGVSVTMLNASFPSFKSNEEYVLLIYKYPSGNATTCGGPAGVFRVSDGIIEPVTKQVHRIKDEMKSRFQKSVQEFKAYLTSRPISR